MKDTMFLFYIFEDRLRFEVVPHYKQDMIYESPALFCGMANYNFVHLS